MNVYRDDLRDDFKDDLIIENRDDLKMNIGMI